MSNDLKRFIGGFALTTLDQIQKREAYQRDIEKEKMLSQLRAEQAKELADYQELLNRKKVDKNLTTADFDSGKRILRNEYGEQVGELDITAGEKLERKLELDKASLETENVRSQISSRAADDARQDRSTGAYIRSLDRQGGTSGTAGSGPNGTLTITDRANEIKFRQKDIVSDLIKSGVPAETVQTELLNAVRHAAARGLPPTAAEEIFVKASRGIRKAYAGSLANTRRTNRSLDKAVTDDEDEE